MLAEVWPPNSLNIFGSWFWPFVSDVWNLIDCVVVTASILGVIYEGFRAVNFLRLLRVFRMVRLVRKLTALRILITALTASVVPVLYSFVVLLLVSSLYAIIATEVFNFDSHNFGTFGRSLFSLFQMATGDSWASSITRGLMLMPQVSSALSSACSTTSPPSRTLLARLLHTHRVSHIIAQWRSCT